MHATEKTGKEEEEEEEGCDRQAFSACPASKRGGSSIRIRRQSAAQMPLGFRSDVSNGSGISMANGTCQILADCLAKGFAKSDGTVARARSLARSRHLEKIKGSH